MKYKIDHNLPYFNGLVRSTHSVYSEIHLSAMSNSSENEKFNDPYGLLLPAVESLKCKHELLSTKPCSLPINQNARSKINSKLKGLLKQDPFAPIYKDLLYDLVRERLCSKHRRNFKEQEVIAPHLEKAIDNLINRQKAALTPSSFEIATSDAWRRCSMEDDVAKDLTPEEMERGYIYILASPDVHLPDNPRETLLKIGFSKTPTNRAGEIQAKCGFVVKLLLESAETDYGRRVEKLIQVELRTRGLRRILKCRGSRCGEAHVEWFRVEFEDAKRTVEHWVTWLALHNPYTVGGIFDAGKWAFTVGGSENGFIINSRREPWHRGFSRAARTGKNCTCEHKDKCTGPLKSFAHQVAESKSGRSHNSASGKSSPPQAGQLTLRPHTSTTQSIDADPNPPPISGSPPKTPTPSKRRTSKGCQLKMVRNVCNDSSSPGSPPALSTTSSSDSIQNPSSPRTPGSVPITPESGNNDNPIVLATVGHSNSTGSSKQPRMSKKSLLGDLPSVLSFKTMALHPASSASSPKFNFDSDTPRINVEDASQESYETCPEEPEFSDPDVLEDIILSPILNSKHRKSTRNLSPSSEASTTIERPRNRAESLNVDATIIESSTFMQSPFDGVVGMARSRGSLSADASAAIRRQSASSCEPPRVRNKKFNDALKLRRSIGP